MGRKVFRVCLILAACILLTLAFCSTLFLLADSFELKNAGEMLGDFLPYILAGPFVPVFTGNTTATEALLPMLGIFSLLCMWHSGNRKGLMKGVFLVAGVLVWMATSLYVVMMIIASV